MAPPADFAFAELVLALAGFFAVLDFAFGGAFVLFLADVLLFPAGALRDAGLALVRAAPLLLVELPAFDVRVGAVTAATTLTATTSSTEGS